VTPLSNKLHPSKFILLFLARVFGGFMKYLILLLLLSSCASYRFTMNRRGIAYIDCATHLMDEGFKQEAIDALCTKALDP